MSITISDAVSVLIGDCREQLATIPTGSVRTCVTSPPYFGLRDYNTGEWIGGDVGCDHTTAKQGKTSQRTNRARPQETPEKATCRKCGATRDDKQIGLEATVGEYITELVSVFQEVHRTLTPDGTLWLNIGDSYGEAKNLIGVPWRVAFALQEDGWILRSDIIWHKTNPMPESVTDRVTKAHEYLFMFAKQPKYYYDADAIKEEAVAGDRDAGSRNGSFGSDGNQRKHEGQSVKNRTEELTIGRETRNKRSVWTVGTQPYEEAHFAVFPPKLIEPCILAGSALGDTVLDPFGGSGTTAKVAQEFGRKAILVELNPAYLPMIRDRVVQYGLAI